MVNKPLKYRCVLFCEDIRNELGGRVSLMGVLGNRLYVQEFPIFFPKFCLFLEWEDIDGEIPIELNILFPGKTEPHQIKPTAVLKGQKGIVARSMIVLNSFAFPTAGPTVFRFLSNGAVIGEETLVVEKFQQPPSAPGPTAVVGRAPTVVN